MGSCNTGGVDPKYENISGLITTNVFLLTTNESTLFDSGQVFSHLAFDSNVYFSSPAIAPGGLEWPPADDTARPWSWRTFSQWQSGGNDAAGTVADPLVADPAGSDFTLAADSPALARGFQQLFPGAQPGPRAT